jgi:hypothetical protein
VKREEAIDIVAMIAANWPSNNWSVASMEAYSRAIEPLDADITTRAVIRAVNELEFYPKVSVLREFVRIEKRMSEPEPPIERSLNAAPSSRMPPWVRGYIISRVRYRDFRPWAEQDTHGMLSDLMPADARDRYMAEGADLSISALFSAVFQEGA